MKVNILLFLIVSVCFMSGMSYADPKISNCDISPKEIGLGTEVTISFDYETGEGGLTGGKIALTQSFKLPDEEKLITRTSNFQSRLQDLSKYTARSGKYETKFTTTERWPGPKIDLRYEFKVTDKNGKTSNPCTVTIRPQ